ncbi:MAG: hypothetical protein VX468_02785, partial [Pseudomonadota bacterium]|nr:hypothetical protein [Pseudomonadota bacterium]
DEVDYSNAAATINADLTGTDALVSRGGDAQVLQNVEDITGSTGDDIFRVDVSQLAGMLGNNMYDGDAGSDIVRAVGSDLFDIADFAGVFTNIEELNLSGVDKDALSANGHDLTFEVNVSDIVSMMGAAAGNFKITVKDGMTLDQAQINEDAGYTITAATLDPDGDPFNGTLDTYTITNGGDTITLVVEKLPIVATPGVDVMNLGAGDNVLDALEDDDTIHGDDGDDHIRGNEGDDSIYGDNGNDTLYIDSDAAAPTGGTDTYDGGAGEDTVSALYATEGVTIDISGADPATDQTITSDTNNIGADTIMNFEHATGSNFDDTLIADAGSSTLSGL